MALLFATYCVSVIMFCTLLSRTFRQLRGRPYRCASCASAPHTWLAKCTWECAVTEHGHMGRALQPQPMLHSGHMQEPGLLVWTGPGSALA